MRGPRYSQTTGKTPVLEREDVRALLASIDASTVAGARDRALIAVMLFSFARVGAVVRMKVKDYRGAGTARASLHLHEKGGKYHAVPAHHAAAEFIEAYLDRAGLRDSPDAPLLIHRARGVRTDHSRLRCLGKSGERCCLRGVAFAEDAALRQRTPSARPGSRSAARSKPAVARTGTRYGCDPPRLSCGGNRNHRATPKGPSPSGY